jgi:hypothetical protein
MPTRFLIECMESGAGIAAIATLHEDNRIAWEEMRNKLEVCRTFEYGRREVRDLCCARSRGTFQSVWLAEGIGYDSSGPGDRDVPRWAEVPFHAGCGLRLAEQCLTRLNDAPGRAEMVCELEIFAARLRELVRPGLTGIMHEALGLCARNLYPWLVPSIDEALETLDPERADLFWHGAGRAMYFAPMHFAPWQSAPWEAFATAADEAFDTRRLANAIAGIAWALTLVNIRHPEVMASVLDHHEEISTSAPFRHGARSALWIWSRSTPSDQSLVRGFAEFGKALGGRACRRWELVITRACASALEDHEAPPDSVFRYSRGRCEQKGD